MQLPRADRESDRRSSHGWGASSRRPGQSGRQSSLLALLGQLAARSYALWSTQAIRSSRSARTATAWSRCARQLPPGTVTALAAHIDDDRACRRACRARSARSAGPWAVWSPLSPPARRRATARIAAAFSTSRPTRCASASTRRVLAQLALARHLIPLLAEAGRNGRYVIIGGPGSEAPWAGYGLRSVAMAATRMLAQVLHDEAQSLGVRVHLLSIDAPLRRDEPGAHECPEWPTVSGIARRVTQLLDAGTRSPPDPSSRAVAEPRARSRDSRRRPSAASRPSSSR